MYLPLSLWQRAHPSDFAVSSARLLSNLQDARTLKTTRTACDDLSLHPNLIIIDVAALEPPDAVSFPIPRILE